MFLSVTFDPVKCLPLVTVQQILSRCARGGPVYWSPLIADVLGLCLQRPASDLPTDGHCLFVPLVYTEPVGLSLFIGSQPQPDPTACEFLGRFADQIAVILTTSPDLFRARADDV
ncbi:MAG: hypothetical protein KatS3mg057_1890 [Herpetosiphonaceae bacterium]|nr:MAG: hypothetical protein KatS3mg057_1890 [Herpetosiphonaceae bacterium]